MRPVVEKTLLGVMALVLLRASGCPSPDKRPYTDPTAGQVLQALKQRYQQVQTLRGESRMGYRSEQGDIKATVRFMTRRGGKLRFDVVSPFDTPLALLVTDGKSFALVDAKASRHFHGPALPCNISRLLQVALRPDEVPLVLSGSTPIIPHKQATLVWDGRDRAEVLTLTGDGVVQVIRLDGIKRRWDLLSSVIKKSDGAVLLSIKPDKYRKVGALRLPERLLVEQPGRNARMDIRYKRLELNPKLADIAFKLPTAQGMPSQRVDCATEVRIQP